MNIQSALVLVLLGVLFGLFAVRVVKNKKIYDVIILGVLVIGMITKLPIGSAIPKTVILVIALGLAVVAVLFFLKNKADTLKAAQKENAIHKENSK